MAVVSKTGINPKIPKYISALQRDTGQLRYLEFQGKGENTSSYPKFEISKLLPHPNSCSIDYFSMK